MHLGEDFDHGIVSDFSVSFFLLRSVEHNKETNTKKEILVISKKLLLIDIVNKE